MKQDDGLRQDWGQRVCWMHPRYGRGVIRRVRKADESSLAGAAVVCPVPASPTPGGGTSTPAEAVRICRRAVQPRRGEP